MIDVAQLFKRDHAKTTDLFERLSDTSDNAVKSRERLFGQLKVELEAHAQVVEEQLYPILKKHRETKDLVPSAKEGNEVEKKLIELDHMPKNDEGFLKSLKELRKSVDQHLRDEEHRMVPAIKTALEGSEIEELATSLNEGKREQLQDARQRMEEASSNRRPHEEEGRKEDSRSQAAESIEAVVRVAADRGRRVADEVTKSAKEGAESLLDESQRFAGQVGSQMERMRRGAVDVAEIYGQTAQTSAERLKALTEASRVAAAGVQEIGRAWSDWLNAALRINMRVAQQLFGCTSFRDVAEVQRSFVEDSMSGWLESSSQMLQATHRLAEEALHPIEDQMAQNHRRAGSPSQALQEQR